MPLDAHRSPEEAALAGWRETPGASARVVSTTVHGARAEVVLELTPSYREWVYCRRTGEGWCVATSGNGPTPGWQDPDLLPGRG